MLKKAVGQLTALFLYIFKKYLILSLKIVIFTQVINNTVWEGYPMKKSHISLILIAAVSLISLPAFAQLGDFTHEASLGTDAGLGEANFVSSTGTYEVLGSGDDIWNTADGMYWVYKEISGNFRVTVSMEWGPQEIPGNTNSNFWKKMGIMFRAEPEDPSSSYVFALLRRDLGAELQARLASGERSVGMETIAKKGQETDRIQLLRTGDVFTMYRILEDGSTVPIGARKVPNFPTEAYVGLAVTSHDVEKLERAFFSSLSIEPVQGVGASVSRDFGGQKIIHSGETMPISLTVDVEPGKTEDLTVTETLPEGWTAGNFDAIRGTASASENIITWNIPDASGGNITLSYEATVGKEGGRLSLQGGVTNGIEFFQASGRRSIFVLPAGGGFGIFDNSMDIIDFSGRDNLGANGAAVYNPETETYTVVGSGNDIWNQADNFHYLYKKVPMDVPVRLKATVKLDPMNGEQTWAKAGPMIRDDLDASASHVFSLIRSGGRDFVPQWRPVFGGNGATAGGGRTILGGTGYGEQNGTVEVERNPVTNETIFYYYDALTGRQREVHALIDVEYLGSLEDETQYYIGLAITSHSVGEISAAVFSDVSLQVGEEVFGDPTSYVREWSIH